MTLAAWAARFALAVVVASAPCAGAPVAAQDPPQDPAPASAPVRGGLDWFEGSFAELGARSKDEQRPVVIYLWSENSRWCPRLEHEALSDAELVRSLKPLLAWQADGARGDGKLLPERFGIGAYPVLLFFDGQGRAIDRLDGYRPKPVYLAEVARVLSGKDTLPDLARQVGAQPGDLDLRTRYALKLEALGDRNARDEQIEQIRKRDRQRKSLPLRRELYAAQLALIQEHFERTREINPGPLLRFLEQERHPELCFEGYRALAAMHLQRGEELEAAQQLVVAHSKRADLRAAITQAAAYLPEDPAQRVGFALDCVATFARFPSELSDADRALMLRLSSDAVMLLPEDARVQASAALASFLNGDKPAAAAALQRARELEPGNPEWPALTRSMGL